MSYKLREIKSKNLFDLSLGDAKWLINQADKYSQLEKAWNDHQHEDAASFLRKCQDIFEDAENIKGD